MRAATVELHVSFSPTTVLYTNILCFILYTYVIVIESNNLNGMHAGAFVHTAARTQKRLWPFGHNRMLQRDVLSVEKDSLPRTFSGVRVYLVRCYGEQHVAQKIKCCATRYTTCAFRKWHVRRLYWGDDVLNHDRWKKWSYFRTTQSMSNLGKHTYILHGWKANRVCFPTARRKYKWCTVMHHL